jgi:hypothetical protein
MSHVKGCVKSNFDAVAALGGILTFHAKRPQTTHELSVWTGTKSEMDWKEEARIIFAGPKPEHFSNYQHCCECHEHDQVLLGHDIDSIGLDQLGNPGWDPLCFSNVEGLKYYFPSLVRLTVDTIDSPRERYLSQFLFHLIKDGPGNNFVVSCTPQQRKFVAGFLEYLIENFGTEINEEVFSADDILKAHEIWSSEP